MQSLVNFCICMYLCSLHPEQDSEHFQYPREFSHASSQSIPLPRGNFYSDFYSCQFSPFFIYALFGAALGLRCCARAFLSCSEQGIPLVSEHELQAHGLQQLQHAASIVVALGLGCCSARGIFPDQGWKRMSPILGADSCLLHHQGSPSLFLNFIQMGSYSTYGPCLAPFTHKSMNFLRKI